MREHKISITTQAVLVICALLLLVNVVLGSILLSRSESLIRTLINERMLDIANTSADMINGDDLAALTAGSEGTPAWQAIYDALKVFQDNISLEYIYTVRDMGDGSFTFLVDPAVSDPGEYGNPVKATDALKSAALGTPAVDAVPYEDDWGKFYSAYSPVFNSAGTVAGVVAVDFRAEWYEEQLSKYAGAILLFSIFSLLVGASVVLIITSRVRKRLKVLNGELGELAGDVSELMRELGAAEGGEASPDSAAAAGGASVSGGGPSPDGEAPERAAVSEGRHSIDELSELGKNIRSMRDNLRQYMDRLHAQAHGMIAALASDYRSVYYVDLDQDTCVCYRADPQMDDGIQEGDTFSFQEKVLAYAETDVSEADRAAFLDFVNLDNIRQRLQTEALISHRYQTVRNEQYEMIRLAGVRRPEDGPDQPLHTAGVGFANVDQETREALARRQALSDALALAENASKAKTAFLSSMSHEIRTPMNAIIGLDSLALNDPALSPKTREYLEKIGASAKHLLGLINDILDMSRIESGRVTLKNEAFSLSGLLDQINTIVESQCREKKLAYQRPGADSVRGAYIGDDGKLKQVLINILGNAVKFTPEGGTVALGVERAARYQGKSTLRFTIRDNGIGMDKAFLPKLFEAFSQENASAANKYGSTGLGMAITKNIVEMMNGKIEVESEKGVGTTFTVSVTLLDANRPGNGGEFHLQGLHVLVIDDDPIAREHAKLILEQAGVASESADSGAEALEMVRLRHARREAYDLILVDWKMPEMDGVETARQIRTILGGESAIIMLTAYHWDEVEAEAIAAGVDSFLAKPLLAADIAREFQRAIQKEREKAAVRKADLAGRRILLAEDMEINAEIMIEILSMREMSVDHAENGRIAVELFAEHPEGWYDAVLMDMRMPEMDGLSAAAAMRSMDRADAKTIPIIALTANAFDEDVQRSLQAGLNAHLSKPVEPENLFATLESLLH